MSSSRHSFSGAAMATSLSNGINSGVTTIPIVALTGTWPNTATGPFVVTIDRGTANEEKILVPAYSLTQFTGVTRGYDGTAAVSHLSGAMVEHTLDATQIDAHDAIVYGVGTSTPSTSAVGDAAANGSATTTPAAGDHKHGRESFGTSASSSALGDSEAAGSASTPSRSDHKHGRETRYASTVTRNNVATATLGVGEFTITSQSSPGAVFTLPSAPPQYTENAVGMPLTSGKAVQIEAGAGDSMNGYQGTSGVFASPGGLTRLTYVGTTWYAN